MAKKTSKQQKKKTKKRTSKQKRNNNKIVFKLVVFLLLFIFAYLLYCFVTLPDIGKAVSRTRQPSTTILAINGNEVQTFGSVYSEIIYPNDLPKYVVDAIISTEDRRFYEHFGFDIISFTRAMIANLFAGRYAQGGSTITQQVAKNLFLTSQKSIKRKVQELLLAFWLEYKFSKDQILALYLNRVYLGAGTYGIEAASQKYFQKTSRDLNMHEAAIIAGMLKAPSRYNPIASKQRAEERAKVVLQNMVNNNSISLQEKEKVLQMRIGPEKYYKAADGKYFADWAYKEVNDYAGERDNDVYALTTLDQDIQEIATKTLQDAINQNKNKNVTQGAVVVMDMRGGIKAMVGGLDYNKSQFNRATQSLRQPGSAFKPFVFLTALEQGYTRDDTIMDSPISIGDWKPENIDKKYHGMVTINDALKNSYNLATINLSEKIGRRNVIKTAYRLGITTEIQNTPSLALGAFEVKVLDMAVAYTTIANGGYVVWPHTVLEIYTKDGYQIYQRASDYNTRIMDDQANHDLTKMLSKVIDGGTGKKAKLKVFAAGKTGTTQDYRDAWFAGFNNQYVCVVWLGNDDNSSMKGITGGGLPAEIWQKIMSQI